MRTPRRVAPNRPLPAEATATGVGAAPAPDRPDVFISYAREDAPFVEQRLGPELVARGKELWIDVEDIRGGASDWRASVWAGIESARVIVFVLTPDSLASTICAEELARAVELNKRVIPVLRRPVDGLPIPAVLERPNWIVALVDDDFDAGALVSALELDEAWLDRHARLTQRTTEWLRNERDASYLLRGSDMRAAERWLDDQESHEQSPTADQVAYISASRRASARRQRLALGGVALALGVSIVLGVIALVNERKAVDRERTANARAGAAQAIAILPTDPEDALRRALGATDIRPDEPEALYALRRSVAAVGWTAILRIGGTDAAGVRAAEFSSDGTRAATADRSGNVAVWDTRTGQRVADMAHDGVVNDIDFSPDGRRIVTASDDGTARIWDSASGHEIARMRPGRGEVWSADYTARGRWIVTATKAGAQVWNASAGSLLRRVPGRASTVAPSAVSRDGRRALTPNGDGGDAWLWTLSSRRRIGLRGHGELLKVASFSRDGARVLTADAGGSATVWSARDGTPIASSHGHSREITDAEFSRDGSRFATTGNDGRAIVWDAATGAQIVAVRHGKAVTSARFDRTGQHLVTAGSDGTARLWRLPDGARAGVLSGHTGGLTSARFSPDGEHVLTASDDGSARLWPTRTGVVTPTAARWRRAAAARFSPADASRLLLIDGRGGAGIWDTRSGRVTSLQGGFMRADAQDSPCGRVGGCAPWRPDGGLIAGGDESGAASVWAAETGRRQRRLAPGVVMGVAFARDGQRVVVVDGTQPKADVWNLTSGAPRPEASVPGRTDEVLRTARFLDAPERVLTVDFAGDVQIFDLTTDSPTALRGATSFGAVAASPDGRHLAVGTDGGELQIFDTRAPRRPRIRRGHSEPVMVVAYSPDGRHVATGGRDRVARVWDARTLKAESLRGHAGPVTSVAFSRDGELVLTTDGEVARLWDRVLRRTVLEFPANRDVSAEFSADGRRIALAGRRRVEVRSCEPCGSLDELRTRARALLPAR